MRVLVVASVVDDDDEHELVAEIAILYWIYSESASVCTSVCMSECECVCANACCGV